MKVREYSRLGYECSVYTGAEAHRLYQAQTIYKISCAGDGAKGVITLYVRNNGEGRREAGVFICPSGGPACKIFRFFQTDKTEAYFNVARSRYWKLADKFGFKTLPDYSHVNKPKQREDGEAGD